MLLIITQTLGKKLFTSTVCKNPWHSAVQAAQLIQSSVFLLSSLGFPLPAHPLLPPAVLSLCSLTQIPAPAMLSHAEPPHSLWISPPSAGLCVTAAQFAHRTHPPPLSGYPSTSSRGFPYVWAAVQCWVLLHTVVFLLRNQSSSHFPSHRAGPMLGHGTLWTGRCL